MTWDNVCPIISTRFDATNFMVSQHSSPAGPNRSLAVPTGLE